MHICKYARLCCDGGPHTRALPYRDLTYLTWWCRMIGSRVASKGGHSDHAGESLIDLRHFCPTKGTSFPGLPVEVQVRRVSSVWNNSNLWAKLWKRLPCFRHAHRCNIRGTKTGRYLDERAKSDTTLEPADHAASVIPYSRRGLFSSQLTIGRCNHSTTVPLIFSDPRSVLGSVCN